MGKTGAVTVSLSVTYLASITTHPPESQLRPPVTAEILKVGVLTLLVALQHLRTFAATARLRQLAYSFHINFKRLNPTIQLRMLEPMLDTT